MYLAEVCQPRFSYSQCSLFQLVVTVSMPKPHEHTNTIIRLFIYVFLSSLHSPDAQQWETSIEMQRQDLCLLMHIQQTNMFKTCQ